MRCIACGIFICNVHSSMIHPSIHSFHYSFMIVTFLIACLFSNDRVLVKKAYCIKKLVSLLLGNQDTSILLMMDFCILTPVQVLTGCVCVCVCVCLGTCICVCLCWIYVFIVACTHRKVILLVSYQ